MDYNTILIVDDEEDNLALLYRIFRNKYTILKTTSPIEGLEIIKNNNVNVVISDHKMPDMDGIEFLEKVAKYNPDIIRILVTAYSDASILIDSINRAAIYQYVKKPYNPQEMTLIVEQAMEYQQLKNDNNILVADLKDLFSGTIMAIIEALDAKDSFTLGRSRRVAFYALKMAQKLDLSKDDQVKIELAGLLHDIGMIGINDDILYKPEPLTSEEYAQIKEHVQHGVKILSEIKQLKDVIEIVRYHHEKYDGSGYPLGIVGDDIPLGARIIAICDTFDSMISYRAYRQALTPNEALNKIKSLAYTQFDPNLVQVFEDVFPSIANEIKNYDNLALKL